VSNKRANLTKLFKCSICAKSDYKEVTPGAVTFLNRCTFTPSCAGLLSVDPNATQTARSLLTWRQTPTVCKKEFASARVITVTHNFGHIGSLEIEPFVQANTATGITRIKLSEFKVLSQTADTVVVDLLTPYTGVIVITDNQFNPPSSVAATTAWAAPGLLTASILTIAADIEVNDFTATLSYKTLTSLDVKTTTLKFINHHQTGTQLPVGGTLWAHYNVIAIEKPYFLYSVDLSTYSSDILQRGNSLQITGTSLPTIIWPMATSQKSVAIDIVQNRIIRNDTVRLGDLVVDNTQLVVANSSIIEELRKPFIIY